MLRSKQVPQILRINALGYGLFSSALALGSGLSQAAEQQAHYDESWAEINQYSPVENFQSRGSYGWQIGVGLLQTGRTLEREEDDPSSPDPTLESPERIPRLTISKGTAWPIDFGLSLARFPEENQVWQYGGHVQWTLWEAFRLPTLALRLSRLETEGMSAVSRLRTDTIQLGSSYAFLRYITLSAAVGLQWQSWQWLDTQENLSLTSWERDAARQRHLVYSWGLRLHPFSPFISLGYEQVLWGEDYLVHHAQLSLLL